MSDRPLAVPGTSPLRAAVADGIGLGILLLFLVDYLRPSLLSLPTIMAGGDTPCHYPTAAWLVDRLLPAGHLHGWYPGAYLGQPVLLYYFPLPFLVMAALAPLVGLPVAFKIGTVIGVFLLPVSGYLCFRLMGFRFPVPLLGAASAFVFLFLERHPIWGGTLASTLTGEFSYTYGAALALVFLGIVYRAYSRGASPTGPALILAVTALAHGYAVLWAGISSSYFLYASRRPGRTLGWLAAVAALAFGLAGFFLVPLLWDWRWTTPYDDPWITIAPLDLFPPLLWPLLAAAAIGVVLHLVVGRRQGGADRRLLFLGHAVLVGVALALVAPALGVIDVRLVPFAQLAACLLGGAVVGLAVAPLAASDLAALGLTLLAALYADARSEVLRSWIDWNYSGLEARELWPAWERLSRTLHGDAGDPRVAVEYSDEHEKAGSIRMYETLPFFSGRSTLEGVYNQASLSTHAVYYVASELGEHSPNPFRNRRFASFDTDAALRHLRLFHVSDVVALSQKLVESLESRDDVAKIASIPPYTVFRLHDDGAGYVVPLEFAPVRSPPRGFRDKAYRWMRRAPPSRALLVFTDDPRFDVAERDEWLPPPERPLPGGVEVRSELSAEEIRVHTSRVGHPLLVKVSYHPRWRAEGADGPYLASPSLMVVVPRHEEFRLVYSRGRSDATGFALSILALVALPALVWQRRRAAGLAALAPRPDVVIPPRPTRRWGGWIPGTLLALMVAAHWLPVGGDDEARHANLVRRAREALEQDRPADAEVYASFALEDTLEPVERAELLCLRGESRFALGRVEAARVDFEEALGLDTGQWRDRASRDLDQAASTPSADAQDDADTSDVSLPRDPAAR